MVPLSGYADRFSVAPGETIAFKISSTFSEPYHARLVRVISGDPNPAGTGIKERDIAAPFAGDYPSRFQPTHLGSYGRVADSAVLHGIKSFTAVATIWPTTPRKGEQGIIAKFDAASGAGFALTIDASGARAILGGAGGKSVSVSVGKALRARTWYRVWMGYDAAARTLAVSQQALQPSIGADDCGDRVITLAAPPVLDTDAPLLFAALGGSPVGGHFNGKIEGPMLRAGAHDGDTIAAWDFARETPTQRLIDTGPHGLHGELVNLPARAMTGSNWNGSEMCWRHAPDQYGAIHFHDDDIYDCGWQTDFRFTVPRDFKSGVYAVRLRCNGVEDMIPFFVRPRRGEPQARACVLIPAFTYIVYANYARGVTNDEYRQRVKDWGARPWTADEHHEFGFSTYNFHSDGSGICYSSRLRPIITMRSAFLAYIDPYGSGLRHFPADLHLIDWLEARGHEYDVITDEDLHSEGLDLIAPYQTVLTTTHPEYQTKETLDALGGYLDRGGRLMYLGGNGFYWRVALNPALPGAVEIRRAEGGIRAWAAEPGEYYHSFDGQYGGLWRRNGRPPQRLCGVGFTSQGPFQGSHYRLKADTRKSRAAWIFEGVENDVIGGFGLSGGGAGGFELDRADARLGTPPHALVLASSEGHDLKHFVLVHEDWLTHVETWPGEPPEKLIRADMMYFETPRGGAVFSVGSITFCGSLAHNGYQNDISRIINNVFTRFTEGE